MESLVKTALVITVIGAINWGLVGMFDFNLVEYLLGTGSLLTRLIYVVVFACGILSLVILGKHLDFDK